MLSLETLSPLDGEWLTLARKMRVARAFTFIVYFSADDRIADGLKSRLREDLIARTATLTEIRIDDPEQFVEGTLDQIFKNAALEVHREACAPFWIDADKAPGDPLWDDARRELLMRLNERRGRLENEVHCPVILQLPDGFQRETALSAPDLWHVRAYSARLTGTLEPAPPNLGEAYRPAPRVLLSYSASTPPGPEIDYWRERLAASQEWSGKPPTEVSLSDGWSAVDAALEGESLALAGEIAAEVLAQARERNDGSPIALRDLLLSLIKAGDVALAQGRLDAATRAYEESLELARWLGKEYGETPHRQRDLSILLNKLGKVAAAQGRLDAAGARMRKSGDRSPTAK